MHYFEVKIQKGNESKTVSVDVDDCSIKDAYRAMHAYMAKNFPGWLIYGIHLSSGY